MKKKRIIYLGEFRFPDGDAAAARVLGIGYALQAIGYKVVFAGWEKNERIQDRQADGAFMYEGFVYHSLNEFRTKNLGPFERGFSYLFAGLKTLEWLKQQDLSDVRAIIAYHGRSLFLAKLHKFCLDNSISLALDCTEWYEPSHLVGGKFGLVSIDNKIRMQIINKKIGNIIGISNYLCKYYSNNKCKTIKIPPLVNFYSNKWRKIDHNRHCQFLRIVYFGFPGKKDNLINIFYGISILKKEGVYIEFNIIGPTKVEISQKLDIPLPFIDSLADFIMFHGRIPQEEVPTFISKFDFSIILRPVKRYSEAGFPTKLVESLAVGLPVIANKHGDIGDYIQDGIEGILIPDSSIESFCMGVKRATKLTKVERNQMRKKAIDAAFKYFDFRNYLDPLTSFFESF